LENLFGYVSDEYATLLETDNIGAGITPAPSEGINMDNTETAYFDRFYLKMTLDDALDCSHAGDCDCDVIAVMGKPYIATQLDAIDPDSLRDELREYGAWSDDELSDDSQNRERIVWIAGGAIFENHRRRDIRESQNRE